MSRLKIRVIGKLRQSPQTGTQFSFEADGRTVWVDMAGVAGGLQAAQELEERQRRHPQPLPGAPRAWLYKGYVVHADTEEPEAVLDPENKALFVKRFILRRERQLEKVRRETETLERLGDFPRSPRESIPEAVRLFVWQRDGGRCVRCGSRDRLEFDHIIPLSAGGSTTERNLQLLCESCNRAKGSSI
jgi:5-methylcytosine-specific restriction endonuclease McrA